jgi:hypothetical protein
MRGFPLVAARGYIVLLGLDLNAFLLRINQMATMPPAAKI